MVDTSSSSDVSSSQNVTVEGSLVDSYDSEVAAAHESELNRQRQTKACPENAGKKASHESEDIYEQGKSMEADFTEIDINEDIDKQGPAETS